MNADGRTRIDAVVAADAPGTIDLPLFVIDAFGLADLFAETAVPAFTVIERKFKK
jgi:hypothetical protein